MSIAENIARVRANIAAAAKEAGRDVSEITLVGASKMNDADACRQASAAGIDVLGENREQEMTKKLAEHAYDGAPLHFIGHHQCNKVKNVVGKVAMIESVGALGLLAEELPRHGGEGQSPRRLRAGRSHHDGADNVPQTLGFHKSSFRVSHPQSSS